MPVSLHGFHGLNKAYVIVEESIYFQWMIAQGGVCIDMHTVECPLVGLLEWRDLP